MFNLHIEVVVLAVGIGIVDYICYQLINHHIELVIKRLVHRCQLLMMEHGIDDFEAFAQYGLEV